MENIPCVCQSGYSATLTKGILENGMSVSSHFDSGNRGVLAWALGHKTALKIEFEYGIYYPLGREKWL